MTGSHEVRSGWGRFGLTGGKVFGRGMSRGYGRYRVLIEGTKANSKKVEVGMSDNTKADDLRGDERNSERAIDLSTKSAMLRVESIEVDKVKEVKREIKLPLRVHGPLYVIGPVDM